MAKDKVNYKVFTGTSDLRTLFILSTLTNTPIHIKDIRSDPNGAVIGLNDAESCFLRILLEMMPRDNDAGIAIHPAATELKYIPGIIDGSLVKETLHCHPSRAMSYYLEPLLLLLSLSKNACAITFSGNSNNALDASLDVVRSVTIPTMKTFGCDIGISIDRRAFYPGDSALVKLSFMPVASLKSIDWLREGVVRKISILSYSTQKMYTNFGKRSMMAAKNELEMWCPSIETRDDVLNKKEADEAPGFGMIILSSSNSGSIIAAEKWSFRGAENLDAADLGKTAAAAFIDEIAKGGCVDRSHQSLVLLMMALSEANFSRLRSGPLTRKTIRTLRLIDEFLGLKFTIRTDEELAFLSKINENLTENLDEKRLEKLLNEIERDEFECRGKSVVLVCRGVNFRNLWRKTE